VASMLEKIIGRKRHILVDTMGLLITVVVHSAGIQDRDGGILVLERIKNIFSRLILIWADGGYRGRFVEQAYSSFKRKIEIVEKEPEQKGFKVLPRRWVVERTLAWLSNYRRHSRDYEYLTESSEAMIYISMIQIMLKRL
jgi:putative transposase